MKRIIIMLLLLTGCTRNACQIAIDQMQPAPKMPRHALIEMGDSIQANEDGQKLLTNYVKMSMQTNSLIESCKSER